MRLIFHYLKNHLSIFLLSTLFLTLEAVADLLQPTFMAYIVDNGVKQSDIHKILHYAVIMLCIALVGAISAVIRNYFSSCTSQAIGKELRRDIYHNVQTLSLENIDRLKPASIITRITNDVTQIQEFINSIMRMMIKAPVTCIGAVVLIITRTPKQSPIILGIIVIVGFLIFGNMTIAYPKFSKVQKALDKLNNVSREFLSSIRVVKAFNAEKTETQKFETASGQLTNASITAMHTMAIFSPLINLTVNLGIVILLWISKNANSDHIGQLMASINYMTQVLFSLGMISMILNSAVRALASSERVREVLEEVPAQTQADHPLAPKIQGSIDFQEVSFTYASASTESLQQISFHVDAGETIGIIGPTGSGKSTLISLIPRFYDASKGRILIDDIDVTSMDEHTLRSAVAIVSQKALLFTGTIADNLRWGKQDATQTEIEEAAKAACADSFILASEKGYDTMLGQGGVNLSGGQKQRLSLARALIRKPKILILDDCTSALDATTEAKVLNHLREHAKNLTVLLISQRISTVMKTDKILCIDHGSIQGFGSHKELLQSCSTYQAIYSSQIGGNEYGKQ